MFLDTTCICFKAWCQVIFLASLAAPCSRFFPLFIDFLGHVFLQQRILDAASI